jgi:hypothetical protein
LSSLSPGIQHDTENSQIPQRGDNIFDCQSLKK